MKIFHLFALSIMIASGSLTAELQINPEPAFIIKGNKASLDLPEGVAFSPENGCIAIANSDSNKIYLYRRANEGFENEPTTIIQNVKEVNFPHDLAFTPDGKYLGVISRDNHCVSIFRCDPSQPGVAEPFPCWSAMGKAASILHPSSIDFSSLDNTLIIVNRKKYGINCYRYLGDGQFEKAPFKQIRESDFLKHDLSATHGIGLSPSGTQLGIVHKHFYGTKNPGGQSGFSIIDLHLADDNTSPETIYLEYDQEEHCLHSIAFHPSGNYVAISKEEGFVILLKFDTSSKKWNAVQTITPIISGNRLCWNGAGPKGIAFSPDGNQLAVAVIGKRPGILIYELLED